MYTRSGVVWLSGCFVWLVAVAAVPRIEADETKTVYSVVEGTVVDDDGQPVEGVRVWAETWKEVEPATTGADGGFRLRLPVSGTMRVFATLLARSGDGRLGARAVSAEASKLGPVTITLKPARSLEVRVVNGAGQPVAGAEVHALVRFHQVASGRTDADGRWTARVPEEMKTNWRVYALKPKIGFDYEQSERARGSAEPPKPLPEALTLSLDGARPPLRIKAVDRAGKPLAGIEVGPWLIQKPGHESQMNGMGEAFQKTDEAGIATIDWLPARHEGKFSIVAGSTKGYYLPDHAAWIDEDPPVDELTLTFFPPETLSGRVLTADGQPSAGAMVQVEGQGAYHNGYSGGAITDADGRFRLSVHSEEAYIITASKGDQAAPYKWGVVVREGHPVEGLEMVLGPATRVRGQVTVGKARKPAAEISISAVIDKGGIPPELKREGDRFYHGVSMWTWTQTDTDGRYEFLLGPGEYRLQGPSRVEPMKLTIPAADPPLEITRDFAMPRPERGPLSVTVEDENGKPVANAVIDGAYQAPIAYFTRVTAGKEGTIHLERSLDPLILVAKTPDQALAGITHVGAEATEAKVVVKPSASASGRLVDPDGKPIPGQELNYGVRVHTGPDRNSPFSYYFGGKSVTDAEGRFQLSGLVVGESYSLYAYLEEEGRIPTAKTTVKPTEGGPMALGDVAIDLSPPKPYVPPTPAERAGESFAARKKKTPREKLEYTLVEAKREYTRPLLLFGSPKDPACVELFRLFNERPDDEDGPGKTREKTPADLRWEFELASLDTSEADARALAKDLGVTLGDAPPLLAVLSDEGTLSAVYPLDLDADKRLDPRSLASFLLKHKLPTRDARSILSEGLKQAKSSDRRVFLIMSASWCGPCRLLARFLAEHKGELNRHYVFVKLDISRDEHAQELIDKYEGKDASNGVPWYVVLGADGQPLVTSNAKEEEDYGSTNIGFPSSKTGIGHFLSMLRQTAPRLSEQALSSLRRELEKDR